MADSEQKKSEERESDAFEDASETQLAFETTQAVEQDTAVPRNHDELRHNDPTAADEQGREVSTVQISSEDSLSQTQETGSTGPITSTSGIKSFAGLMGRGSTLPPRSVPPPQSASNDILHPTQTPIPSDYDTVSETTQGQPPKRNIFKWLSRSTSNVDKPANASLLPSQPSRSRTASTTSNGTPEELVGRRTHRNSLQSRFKIVRLREEAGIETLDDTHPLEENEISPVEGLSPKANGTAEMARQRRSLSNAKTPAAQRTFSESLPPGMAAGIAAGPESDLQGPVDWDLWQDLVYEGPVAVARTSPDELNVAITRGIPSAIRGVVWQILAQSKNDELEAVYRDLVARGKSISRRSSDFKARPGSYSSRVVLDPADRRESAPPSVTRARSPERVRSSASSIHSDDASSPKSLTNGVASSPLTPQDGFDSETLQQDPVDPVTEERKRLQDQANVQRLEKTIKRDMGTRTSFSKFLMSANLQDGLFGICKAYALYDEEVGYAQGMNFIAMPLLFNMPEEEAFCLFVKLMNQYQLRDLFVPEMSGLHLHLYQFERLLEDLEPAVYCHLHRRGVSPDLYATQWFLTLFAYRFPLQLVLRIYDLILSEGLESAILKFGMVLMQKNAKALLEMKDMSMLTTFLKERLFDVYIDSAPSATSILESGFFGSAGGIDNQVYRADALVQDACSIRVTPELLKQYTVEWNEKMREETETRLATETLRASSASLTVQNRQLTERLQTSDTEHVQVTSELIRAKVENQRLSDENESLKMQVVELQTIVQAQPGEVEDRLRQEMDRIMKRNIEVQNENRALEDNCTEMERELVQAKMLYAESNGELDIMRQKWSAITTMMSNK